MWNKTTNLGEEQQQQQQHDEDDDKWGGQHSNQWTAGRLVDSNQISGFRKQQQQQWEHAIFGLFSTTTRRRRIGGEKHFNAFK